MGAKAKEPEIEETSDAIDVAPQPVKQPLFFKSPHPVDVKRHKDAGFSAEMDIAFAKETNSVPLAAIECIEAARSYPIVFSAGDEPMPVAIVGMKQKNVFMDDNNIWEKHHYVPMYVRKYPFALMPLQDNEQFILCVDEGCEAFMIEDADQRLYDEGGNPSNMSEQAVQFCSNYQKHHKATVEIAKAIKGAGLLEAKQVKANKASGGEVELGGFMVISEQKMRELDDATLLDWHKKGWLGIISSMLISQINWKYLASRM